MRATESTSASPAVPLAARPYRSVLLGGILGLLVAMGIGRFAFTLLLPLMQHDAHFGPHVAGWLASANFLGYFAGSLTATLWPTTRGTRGPLLLAFAISTLTTLGMGLTTSVGAWVALRFLSGAASAWIFVFVTALVLTHLRDAGRASLAGWIYAGVGVGIAFTAAFVLVVPLRDSATLWLVFGVLSALVLAASAFILPSRPTVQSAAVNGVESAAPVSRASRGLLLLAYSLEGIGYVVSATFIVAVVNTAQGTFEAGAWTWMVVGLSGIPACVLWTRNADYRGLISRLATAFWIQAAGIVAVALAPSSTAMALVSAATLGATLTGMVMLTMQLAARIAPDNTRRVVGQLTVGFSAGQMLGPVLAGYAASYFGSFTIALLGSAGLLVVSALATHAMGWRAATAE